MTPRVAAFALSTAIHLGIGALFLSELLDAQPKPVQKPLVVSINAFAPPEPQAVTAPPKPANKPAPKPLKPKKPSKPKTQKRSRPVVKHPQPVVKPVARSMVRRVNATPPRSIVDPGLWASYKQALRSAIAAQRRYPLQSRRRREQGTVIVHFTISPNGEIDRIHISRSSGYSRLDQAALAAVRAVGRFHAFPDGITKKNREMTLPVSYSL